MTVKEVLPDYVGQLKEQITELKNTLKLIGAGFVSQRQSLSQLTQELRDLLAGSNRDNGSQHLFQSILRAIPPNQEAGVLLVDQDGKYLLSNGIADSLLGHTWMKEPTAEKHTDISFFQDDRVTPNAVQELPWRQCARGSDVLEVLLHIRRAGVRSEIWVRSVSVPLKDQSQNSHGAVSFLLDISETALVENQIRSLLGGLEQQLTLVEDAHILLRRLTSRVEHNITISPPVAKAAPPAAAPPQAPPNDQASTIKENGTEKPNTFVVSNSPKSTLNNHVLIVDDIPVNQKLLRLQVKRLGFNITIVSNGREAFEAVEKHDFDIIFMDLDMPVMDGPTATKTIRKLELTTKKHVPIIAMTSYDTDADRKLCVDAGMDDYLVKGASPKQLAEVFNKYVFRTDSAPAPKEPNVPELVRTTEQAINSVSLESLSKGSNKIELDEVFRLFSTSLGTFVECMRLAIDEKNAEAVKHFAHCIKGPASVMSLTTIVQPISEILACVDSGDWLHVDYQYMTLRSNFSKVVQQMTDISTKATQPGLVNEAKP
jgi:CheY-like chemotaxis protein/PAS domain-containing protein